MRLTDLDPHWLGLNGWASPERHFFIGVRFLCPCCRQRRMFVLFENAIDPSHIAADPICGFDWPPRATTGEYAPERLCRREGETFDDLSISPPIGSLELLGCRSFTVRAGEVTLCA